MVIALLVTLIPPLMFDGGWQEWIYKGLTLLLIGCPCAGDPHARAITRAGGGGTARRIDKRRRSAGATGPYHAGRLLIKPVR